MTTCSTCRGEMCEAPGCTNLAEFEGWVRCKDGMGIYTGLIQRRQFCDECRAMLAHHGLLVGA